MTASDLLMAGQENDIVGRVAELERLVNILTSRGVSARSASDFVQDLGQVNGGNLDLSQAASSLNAASINVVIDQVKSFYVRHGLTSSTIYAAAFDPNDGNLVVGGIFSSINGVAVNGIAKINITTGAVSAYGTGVSGVGNIVYCIGFDPANSNRLVIGGAFTAANGVTVNNLAYWNGSTFVAYGTGTNNTVDTIGFDPANSNRLVIGGQFTTANGVTVNGLAYWSGSTFVAYGTGVSGGGAIVLALKFDPNDSKLVIGGNFTSANGVSVNYLAKWNGSTFTAYGTGTNSIINILTFDPTDNNLVIGGGFTTANGVTVNYLAKWTGSTFISYGSGMSASATVQTIGFDPLDNNNLVVGGLFTTANGVSAINIAKWNGSTFVAYGSGISAGPFIIVFDSASGSMYVGGGFVSFNGIACLCLIKYWVQSTLLNILTQLLNGECQLPHNLTVMGDEMVWSNAASRVINSTQVYGYYWAQASAVNGDTQSMGGMLDAGTYTLHAIQVTSTSGGKIDIFCDGVLIQSGYDLYSSSTVYNVQWDVAPNVTLTAGYHLFQMVVNGKNGSSTGYNNRITKFWVTPANY